jgi:hypothetical protein
MSLTNNSLSDTISPVEVVFHGSKILKNFSHIPIEYSDHYRSSHKSCIHNFTKAHPELTEKRLVYEQIKHFNRLYLSISGEHPAAMQHGNSSSGCVTQYLSVLLMLICSIFQNVIQISEWPSYIITR